MEKAQYSLSDLTTEEKDAFLKEFNELLNKHSVYYEPVPQLTRTEIGKPFEVTCQILLQKKTKLVPDTSILSPFIENNDKPTTEN